MTATETEFADPGAPGAGIQWVNLNGALLLIDVHGVEVGVKTAFGTTDAVRASVVVLDGDHADDEYPDTLVFPKIVAAQLRRLIGRKVLGRLGQGQAKSGQDAPWVLDKATDSDIQVGRAHTDKIRKAQDPVGAAPPF